jgi:NMD protein affecting ribosome stability and mRNA decay
MKKAGRPRKFTDEELTQLLREEKGPTEIAKKFNVTKQCVSKRIAELRKNTVVCVSKPEKAQKIINQSIDAVAQLQKINNYANEILDLMIRWIRGENEAIQILESKIRKVRHRKTKELVDEFKFKDPHEVALKAMAEIRGQIDLQLQIFKTLYSFKAIEDFQRIVLDAIKSVDPNTRDRIVQELSRQRLLRSAFGPP